MCAPWPNRFSFPRSSTYYYYYMYYSLVYSLQYIESSAKNNIKNKWTKLFNFSLLFLFFQSALLMRSLNHFIIIFCFRSAIFLFFFFNWFFFLLPSADETKRHSFGIFCAKGLIEKSVAINCCYYSLSFFVHFLSFNEFRSTLYADSEWVEIMRAAAPRTIVFKLEILKLMNSTWNEWIDGELSVFFFLHLLFLFSNLFYWYIPNWSY